MSANRLEHNGYRSPLDTGVEYIQARRHRAAALAPTPFGAQR